MQSRDRRPSHSVSPPARTTGPVRLGNQQPGGLFVPFDGRNRANSGAPAQSGPDIPSPAGARSTPPAVAANGTPPRAPAPGGALGNGAVPHGPAPNGAPAQARQPAAPLPRRTPGQSRMAPGAAPRRPPPPLPPPPIILPPPPEEPPAAERAQDESPAEAAPKPGPEDAPEAGQEATPEARRGVPAAAFVRIPPSPVERSTAEPATAEPATAGPEQAQPRAIPPGAVQRGAIPPSTIQPGAAQHGASRPPEPSWGTVLATTVRLWTGRRLANPRWRAGLVLVLAAIVFVAAAIPLALSRGSVSGGQHRATQGRSRPSPGAGGLAAAAAARRHAAVWVARQVSTGAVVSCDPAMCGALEAAHVPAGRLIVLGPGQGDPLGSEVLVATAALRNQFGPRLTSVYAPVVLASFGSGAAQIQIRVIAPDGSGVYMSQLAADVAARKSSGAQMLHNPQLHMSPAARGQIAAGYVDPRLLGMLVTLSGQYPVEILGFGGSPGSNVSVVAPLRSADITGTSPDGGQQPASAQVLRSFLSAQRPPYRPSAVTIVRLGSRTVLRVEYPAPTPLGLLGSHG